MKVFRHADPRFPFLWEEADQPAARWHGEGDGPAHYFADTPAGAWAEFLRHEEIREPADLEGVERALWVVEIPDDVSAEPELPDDVLRGGPDSYERCREKATRLRRQGGSGLRAPSAALESEGSRGWRVDGGLRPTGSLTAVVLVLFGPRPDLVGWPIVDRGRPPAEVLDHVRYF